MNQDTNGLYQDVLQLIEKIYCKRYTGRLEVVHNEANESNPSEYIVHLYPHLQLRAPLCMAFQCDTDEEFLSKLEQELKSRNLIRSEFYKIELHGNN